MHLPRHCVFPLAPHTLHIPSTAMWNNTYLVKGYGPLPLALNLRKNDVEVCHLEVAQARACPHQLHKLGVGHALRVVARQGEH